MLPILALLALAGAPSAAQAPKAAPPPGMVLIPGGSTWIGTDRAELERAAEDNVARFLNLANETPLHQRPVDAFFLGVTEVTNEQFAQYVRATGARPPDSWGLKAIEAASQQHALELGKARNAAREQGKPPPETAPFDQVRWWNENWRDAAWEIPAGQEALPAGYIDFEEAEAYARWAGVRLMTEFEYQRAARGGTKHAYPWGDKWDPTLCASGGLGLKAARPVGSYPPTAQGVHDLSGNVWEWTSSPFVAYPGFKVIQVKRRGETIDALVAWNASQRVVVGGSYATESPSAARVATRRPTDPDQSAEAMGFRIAASTAAGVDIAATVLRGFEAAAGKHDPSKAVVCDRWRTVPGKAGVAGYAVIEGYDFVAFVPAVGLDYTSLGQLELASLESGPIDVGVLASSEPMVAPALPAGAWTVALRGPGPLRDHESIEAGAAESPGDRKGPGKGIEKGKDRQGQQDEQAESAPRAVVYPAGFEPDRRTLLFRDAERRVLGWVPIEKAEFVVPSRTSVEIGTGRREVVEGAETRTVEVATLSLSVLTWVKVANKAVGYTIPLAFGAGEVTPDWRH